MLAKEEVVVRWRKKRNKRKLASGFAKADLRPHSGPAVKQQCAEEL
jgi:hypothetical protein